MKCVFIIFNILVPVRELDSVGGSISLIYTNSPNCLSSKPRDS